MGFDTVTNTIQQDLLSPQLKRVLAAFDEREKCASKQFADELANIIATVRHRILSRSTLTNIIFNVYGESGCKEIFSSLSYSYQRYKREIGVDFWRTVGELCFCTLPDPEDPHYSPSFDVNAVLEITRNDINHALDYCETHQSLTGNSILYGHIGKCRRV